MGIFYNRLELDPDRVNKLILDGFKSIIDDLNNNKQTKQKMIKEIEKYIKKIKNDPEMDDDWAQNLETDIEDIKKVKNPLRCSVVNHYEPCGIIIDVLHHCCTQDTCSTLCEFLEDDIIEKHEKDSKNKQLIDTYKLDIFVGESAGTIHIKSKLKNYEYKKVGKDTKK